MSILRSPPLIALTGLVCPSSQAFSSIQGVPTCGDFLESWDKKPAELQFVSCEYIEHSQVDRLETSYVVEGAQAATVEALLKKEFGLSSLRFLCCYWDAVVHSDDGNRLGNGTFIDTSGHRFQVMMHSGETLVTERAQWEQIPEFHVRVRTYLGTP